jgi:hypothetical protein
VLVGITSMAVRGQPRMCLALHTFVASGRSAVQITSLVHKSAVEPIFIRYQRTKAQPVRKPGHMGSQPSGEQSNIVDPDVTLYHRPKQHSFNINLGQPKSSVEGTNGVLTSVGTSTDADVKTNASFSSTSDTSDATEKMKETLRAILRQQTAAEQDKDVANVHSIEELMCHEVKPGLDMSRLPGIYARLAKLRLTGK